MIGRDYADSFRQRIRAYPPAMGGDIDWMLILTAMYTIDWLVERVVDLEYEIEQMQLDAAQKEDG